MAEEEPAEAPAAAAAEDPGAEPSALEALSSLTGTSSKGKGRKKAPARGGSGKAAPNTSMQRSQFGPQTDSNKRTAPGFGFGTAFRFHPHRAISKQFISKEHSKQELAADTPGPGQYPAPSAVGAQTKSTLRSMPRYGFGSSQRFSEELRIEKQERRLPAPGTYEAISSVGRQEQSTKETNPIVGFCTALREQRVSIGKGYEEDLHGHDSPGPAMYTPVSGFGDQPASGKASGSAFGFGTNPRAIDPRVPNAHERRSALVPGPGKYPIKGSVGVQADAMKASLPMYGFGTCDRDHAAMASLGPLQANTALVGYLGPGPAGLGAGPAAVGTQHKSTKKTAPKISFGHESRFRANIATSEMSPGPGTYVV